MTTANYVINLVLSGVLIVGAYQFYFFCQRNAVFEPREFCFALDEKIPYMPGWVWIYSFLYYPAILYVNLVVESPGQFTYVASSYMLLLALQVAFFMAFPVKTPQHWRPGKPETRSERFLAFVQRFDAPSNSFPSMHTSVAMLTAMHCYHCHGNMVFAFPLLIGLSCLFTKQHYIIDIPAGAALGWGVFSLHASLVGA